MKVLIVSYYFPPQNVIAAVRVGKLARYIADFGWEPWVLTLRSDLFPSAGDLPIEIPEGHVIRADLGRRMTRIAMNRQLARREGLIEAEAAGPAASGLRLAKGRLWAWLSAQFTDVRFPDRAMPWVRPAVRAGAEFLRGGSFAALFSSHGPPSSHRVAAALSRGFALPWVADYRDLWTQSHIQSRREPLQWLETRFERSVMKKACALTTVSEPLARQLESLHNKPVTVIPNGFDEEDYRFQPSGDRDGVFRIAYTGMIYPGKRDPSIVFQAVRRLIDAAKLAADKIEVQFFGSDSPLILELARRAGVESCVRVHPRIPNQEAIRRQIEADLLLLLEWPHPSAKGVYTGKVFEYLGARRPILATGPEGGVIESLLRETQSGTLVHDAAAAAAEIERLIEVKRVAGSTRLPQATDVLRPYTRRWQARQLARILDACVADGRAQS